MKQPSLLFVVVCALLPLHAVAHPGSGLVVDAQGNVFVSDITRGLLKVGPEGKFSVVVKEAGHWLTLDAAGRFARMDFEKSEHWPRWFKRRTPLGAVPALITDGGSPLVVHRDGHLYYVCNDERMIPGGLQIGRLSTDGKLALVAPRLRSRADELGGIKGLAAGPDDSLYVTCPSAVLRIPRDGAFTIVKHPVVAPDCDGDLPPNTPPSQRPFLTGLTLDAGGNFYLAATGCRRLLKMKPDGQCTVLLKSEPPWSPTAVALHGDEIYVAEWTNANGETHDYRPRVRKLGRDGKITTLATLDE